MAHPLVSPHGQWMRDVISDAAVVRRVQGGESELFELLVRRHNQRLFRAVRSIALDDDEAEEALQQAYVNAWRALSSFDGRSSFITWMTRIALRTATALVGTRRRRREVEDLAASAQTMEPTSANPLTMEREDMRRLLETAIDKLPETYRVVFVLRAVQGLSTRAVASDLEISESTVKVRLFRARANLQVQLLRRAEELGALAETWSFDGDRCDRVAAGVFERIRSLPME
jgi:RNA polymerase sigma-70 factor (ECF subfamily)